MNEKHASIETLQKIKALQKSLTIQGSRINNAASILLTTFSYSVAIYYLFTSDNSLANQYRAYLDYHSKNVGKQNIEQTLNAAEYSFSEMMNAFDQETAELGNDETVYSEILDGLEQQLNALRAAYGTKGNEFTRSELWDLFETELTQEGVLDAQDFIEEVSTLLIPTVEGAPNILSILQGMNLSRMFQTIEFFLDEAHNSIIEDRKEQMNIVGRQLVNRVNKKAHDVYNMVANERSNLSEYILRLRYIPELIGLFITHFLMIKPTLSKLNSYGVFSPKVQIPDDEYLTEQKGIELIQRLKTIQRNNVRKTRNITWGSKLALGSFVLGYFIFDVDSPLYWLLTVNAFLLASADYYQSDQLEKNRIRNTRRSDQNKATLSSWLKNLTAFPIKHNDHIEDDAADAYVVLNFFDEKMNPQHRQKYKMLNKVFNQLLAHYQIDNISAESHKIAFYLAQPVQSIHSLCQISQQRMAELIEREIQLSLLLSQIKNLDNYLFLSADLKTNFSPELEKSYSVKISIRHNLVEKFTLMDKAWIAPDQSLTFEMKGPIPDDVFKEWITVLENHSTASFQPISPKSISSHQPLDDQPKQATRNIAKKGKERESSLRIEPPINPEPKTRIKWLSAELDSTKNANSIFTPREVENAPGHYVICFFTQKARPKNCPKGAYETLKKMITDRPKFSGETGQGLKRANGHVKNKNGVIVPASRKAKPKGTYGIWRAASFTETAPTGEHLDVYLPENIYIGH